MSFLDRVRECISYDLANFSPFVVDGVTVGHVRKSLVDRLGRFPDIFVIRSDCVAMRSDLQTPADRTAAMTLVVNAFVDEGVVNGVRDERYPVAIAFGDAPMLEIERAAVPVFGVRAFGIHLNGYVRSGNDTLMWVARRSMKKQTYPGRLDQLVAGGQPVGISLSDNLVKECREEASMPEALARQAVPVPPISYCFESDHGLHPNLLYCYDLELPMDFQPHKSDLEVEQFYLWPVERVMDIVATTGDFKANCNLVAIDFFIRHGFLTPNHPDYLELVDLLYGYNFPESRLEDPRP
jgi:isopentenyldiphosphate isomerase